MAFACRVLIVLAALCAFGLQPAAAAPVCPADGRTLNVGFYIDFEPVSYSDDRNDPESAGIGTHPHRGYEADLLTALEAMPGAGLRFVRAGIPTLAFGGVWLLAATSQYDVIGGGISVREDRTFNKAGRKVIAFTSGHVVFRQSLLVRKEDAARLSGYDRLTPDIRVGVHRDTTGEARLLQLTGLADDGGILRSGVRVTTDKTVAIADGTQYFRITAAGASPGLDGRRRLEPPDRNGPTVIYHADEDDQLSALSDGTVDAVARGEIGNADVAHESGGRLAIAARDDAVEFGGFAVAVEDQALLACLNDGIDWLTDGRRIGYPEWRDDPGVFLRRAALQRSDEQAQGRRARPRAEFPSDAMRLSLPVLPVPGFHR